MTARPRFHLAFPVADLAGARHFYGDVLQCREGRSADDWIDFDFFGHQVVAHLAPQEKPTATNIVDAKSVPVRHFGVILEWSDWEALQDRFRAHEIEFLVEPYTRFEGQAGEQGTMFVNDPSGNALEFKAFRDDAMIFANDDMLQSKE